MLTFSSFLTDKEPIRPDPTKVTRRVYQAWQEAHNAWKQRKAESEAAAKVRAELHGDRVQGDIRTPKAVELVPDPMYVSAYQKPRPPRKAQRASLEAMGAAWRDYYAASNKQPFDKNEWRRALIAYATARGFIADERDLNQQVCDRCQCERKDPFFAHKFGAKK